MKKPLVFIAVLAIAGVSGFTLQRAFIDHENQNLTAVIPQAKTDVIGQIRPEFALKDLDGELRNITEWDGKVLLVNFWATWCPPCKKEIPAFMNLQQQYGKDGFQVIGIAIDDEQSVADYSDTIGINYPIMPGEIAAAEIARRYGNRINALPFTAFVGRDGKIAVTKPGEISQAAAEKIILSLL
ncbi:MAG: redoxin family protein [Gammaproteobacteria bacterium]|nr:redoxin family protein [Gammaproteobacteria bacterium]